MAIKNFLAHVDENIMSMSAGEPDIEGLMADSSVSLGKRLRAALFFGFAGKRDKRALDIASAIEMIHSATLIHDDILDGGDVRRGRKALYLKYGVPASLLFGDYLLSKAFSVLSREEDGIFSKSMSEAMALVVSGEISQQLKKGDTTLTREEYLEIIGKKTGELFGAACKLGSVLGGGGRSSRDSAFRFGKSFGISYQIFDDCRDWAADLPDKTPLRDAANGTITLPIIFLAGKAPGPVKARLRTIFARLPVREKNCAQVKKWICENGALSRALLEAEAFLLKAESCYRENKKLKEGDIVMGIISSLKEKINGAKKEYTGDRRRVRRGKRSQAVR